MTDKTKLMIATAGGLGLSPVFPGSCGALLGVVIHLAIAYIFPTGFQTPLLLGAFFLVFVANHVLTPWAEAHWQEQDSRHFVLDEVAGYLVIPLLFYKGQPWQIAFWGYLLFRAFDTIKIPPARQIDQRIKNAWGVVLDDLVSAVYAVMVMYMGYYAWAIMTFIKAKLMSGW
jgi:phosphatidylglycerophosphatase A